MKRKKDMDTVKPHCQMETLTKECMKTERDMEMVFIGKQFGKRIDPLNICTIKFGPCGYWNLNSNKGSWTTEYLQVRGPSATPPS